MVEKMTEQTSKHNLQLDARQHVVLSGVTEVESFDEQTVELITNCGALTLEGEGLHIGTLDIAKGVVEVTGKLNGIYYSDAAPVKRGLRSRLLR